MKVSSTAFRSPDRNTCDLKTDPESIQAVFREKGLGTSNAPRIAMFTERDDPETYAIIGAAMAVHSKLRNGFLEKVYRVALPIEFGRRKIPFVAEAPLPVYYDGELLPVTYRVDFVCFKDVIVECKAAALLTTVDEAQVINYLRASNRHRGLLVNFGAPSLQYRRLAWGKPI